MYFTFIKMVIAYLTIRFLIFDIYNILASMNGEYCSNLMASGSQDLCDRTISGYNLKSAANTSELNVLEWLSLAFTIISIVFFYVFRRILNEQKNRSRSIHFSQDEFSILIEDIPPFIFN